MRIALNGGTNNAVLQEGDLDIADTITRWSSFQFYLSPDFAATANDTFNIYELQSTADTVIESAIGLRITATTNAVEIGVGQVTATTFATSTLQKGRWYHFDLRTVIQTGGTGTVDLYIDGAAAASASVTTLTNVAVTTGALGAQLHLSTTTGTMLFDGFRFDDLRVYPFRNRYPETVQLTMDGHIFVGSGWIESAQFLSASGTAILYDTDTAGVLNAESVIDLDTARGRAGFDNGAFFQRGCYVDMSTNSILEVKLATGSSFPRRHGPMAYGSPGAVRSYASRRRSRPQNV